MTVSPQLPSKGPFVDASVARSIVDQSHELVREDEDRHRDYRDRVALHYVSLIIDEIVKVAANGQTQLEYFIRDRWIRTEHRQDVIQGIIFHLDARGFSVLSYPQYSILGSGSMFQIEW